MPLRLMAAADSSPDDLLVFDMEDQRTGRARQKIQQIHALRRLLVHG